MTIKLGRNIGDKVKLVKETWNAYADQYNQWDALGLDEKMEQMDINFVFNSSLERKMIQSYIEQGCDR